MHAKHALGGFGLYIGYRLFMLASTDDGLALTEDASLLDDLSSSLQTGLAYVSGSADFKGIIRPVDPKTGEDYSDLIYSACRVTGMPPLLMAAQMKQESGFDKAARSGVGAKGLAQFMPGTATEWGVDVTDPASSINGQGKYMAWLYRRLGTWRLAVIAYNWGIGNVQKKGIAAMPKETRDYVARVYDQYADKLPA